MGWEMEDRRFMPFRVALSEFYAWVLVMLKENQCRTCASYIAMRAPSIRERKCLICFKIRSKEENDELDKIFARIVEI